MLLNQGLQEVHYSNIPGVHTKVDKSFGIFSLQKGNLSKALGITATIYNWFSEIA